MLRLIKLTKKKKKKITLVYFKYKILENSKNGVNHFGSTQMIPS